MHTVLVTNLVNRVQPIIRYDLGDSVTVVPDPCPCGRLLPVIRVEGRTDEILAFPLADGQTIHLLPLALSTVVEETPGIHRRQLIQTGPATAHPRNHRRQPPAQILDYILSPIGFLHSPLTSREEAPRQGREGAPDAWLEVQATMAEGLEGMAVGDELIVITSVGAAKAPDLERLV